MADVATLLQRYHLSDRRALARLLTLVSRGEHLTAIAAGLFPLVGEEPRKALVIAVTGSGGAGKSTLIGKLLETIRTAGLSVAVLACDPESPISGGALMGDRFRMPSRADDDGVFIRSLAASSGQEAVAEHLDLMVRLLAEFGFAVILIETVGAGQGDVRVRDLADIVVLLVQPETGDELQWEKAGVLEVADVIVVNKADLPGAEQVAVQVRRSLDMAAGPQHPVLLVSARTGQGVAELWETLRQLQPQPRTRCAVDELLDLTRDWVLERLRSARRKQLPGLKELAARWQDGSLPPRQAVAEVMRHLLDQPAQED